MEDAIAYISISSEESGSQESPYRRDHPVYADRRLEIVYFAKTRGFRVRQTICDVMDGLTGDLFLHPGIQQILVAAGNTTRWRKVGSFHPNTVLVYDCSDFCATELELGAFVLDLRQRGIKLFEVVSSEELTGDQAHLWRIPSQTGPEQRQQVKARLTSAKRKAGKVRNGSQSGPKPFGTLPGEAETIREMCRLRRKPPGKPRISYAQIAAALNARGLSTRSGRPWEAKTVQVIIGRARPYLLPRYTPRGG